ncbi:MAG TPA: formyltransferase family protein, partial [Thermomicrobiales bacterium]|nr:formyltransferase family protein [Thermomicrobiales bacterium]
FTKRAMTGALARGGVEATVVVLPRAPKPLGAGWPEPPLDRWLRERGAAIVEVDRLEGSDLDALVDAIDSRDVALGVGACFPYKIPATLRAALPRGALNIHPSLLPALRGPEPVFHTYRQGLTETGVTIHLMDAGWDSGPVLAQERVVVPEQGRADDFEAALARRGGEMLGVIARPWCDGTIDPVPQDEAAASWAPLPSDRDRVIPADLRTSQAARFVRACGPLLARDGDTGELVPVIDVIDQHQRDFEGFRASQRLVRTTCSDGDLWLLRHTHREFIRDSGMTI